MTIDEQRDSMYATLMNIKYFKITTAENIGDTLRIKALAENCLSNLFKDNNHLEGERNRARRKTDNEIWGYIDTLKTRKNKLLENNFKDDYQGRELDQINSLIYALEWTLGAYRDARTGEYL